MFERRVQKSVGIIAAIFAGSLAAGCTITFDEQPDSHASSTTTNQSGKVPKTGLPRCFKDPMPGSWPDTLPRPFDNLSLPYNAATESFGNDPKLPSKQMLKKLGGAIVEITHPAYTSNDPDLLSKGSGFFVKNSRGERLVITAAHVAQPATLKDISITDNNGHTTGVASGCYIFDNPSEEVTPQVKNGTRVNADIAILKPKESIGSGSLKFAATEPSRGDWGVFVNYQEKNSPGVPAIYTGIIAATKGHDLVVTGINPWIDAGDETPNAVAPGSSGGVFVDWQTADVYSMSYARVVNKHDTIVQGKVVTADTPYTEPELYQYFNISLPGSNAVPAANFDPRVAVMVDGEMIKRALESDKYS